jgi:WD40 repeat protein
MNISIHPESAKRLWSIPWDTGFVTAASFLASPHKLAAGNDRGEILLWDLPERSGKDLPPPRRLLKGHSNFVTALAATPDGRWLISASYDHTVRMWDMTTEPEEKQIIVMEPKQKAVKRGNGKPNEKPPEIQVEMQTKSRIIEGHKDWVRGFSLSSDGTRLLTGDERGQAILWEIPEGKELRRWQVPGWLQGVALSRDARQMATCEFATRHALFKNTVKLWDPATGEMKADLSQYCSRAACVGFSPDGTLLATGMGGEWEPARVSIIEVATGKKLRELAGHKHGVHSVLFHPDGKHVLSSGRDTCVRIWQIADGKQVGVLGHPRGGQTSDIIFAQSLAPDDTTLATADMGGLVEVWSLAS